MCVSTTKFETFFFCLHKTYLSSDNKSLMATLNRTKLGYDRNGLLT